jgi:hypothetical protein
VLTGVLAGRCCVVCAAALLFWIGAYRRRIPQASRPATAAAPRAAVRCGDAWRAYRHIGWPPGAKALPLWLCAGRGPRRQQHELLKRYIVDVETLYPAPACDMCIAGSRACTGRCKRRWLGACRGLRRQQHELLVASGVRGVMPAPWPTAVCGGLTVWLERMPGPAKAAARAAGRFGGRGPRRQVAVRRPDGRPAPPCVQCSAGALAGRFVQRPYWFGSAHAGAHDSISMSCSSLRR